MFHSPKRRESALSSFVLRLIALVCMCVDHAGLALFPSASAFRCVGRLAFPLYCFLLAQGFAHTRDIRAYARRLLLLACVSELPFDLLIFGRLSSAMEQNVVFSLLLGLLALCAAGGGEDCARLLENLLREVSEKYWRLQRHVQCLSIPDGRRRLAFYLCAQGAEDFLLPISREQMARQLGMNRAALSRLLGQLRDEGLLRWERAHFLILRPEELRAIAEDG